MDRNTHLSACNETSNEMTELTPEVLAKIRDILSSSTAQTKRATHVSDSTERVYYYVEYRGFATVVSSRDITLATDAQEAQAVDFAFNDKLQPWYRLSVLEQSIGISDPQVTKWTHNDFCDWLRRRE